MEKYKIIKELGNGSFGIVYKATNTTTGETVAIKKFKQKYTNWD
jgi:serine/threonine protein kinase